MVTLSSRPEPTLIASARAVSCATSSAATWGAAITREVAVQRWPVDPKAPLWIPAPPPAPPAAGRPPTPLLAPPPPPLFPPRLPALSKNIVPAHRRPHP